MRIVSLIPSATEIVCALGLGDQLVGVTHACDFPPDVVAGKPVVTSSVLAPGETDTDAEPLFSREIDDAVRRAIAAGESLYTVDREQLLALKPDLLITQGLCDVCAVGKNEIVPIAEAMDGVAQVLSLEPTTLDEVLGSFRAVGGATNRAAEAEMLAAGMQARWGRVRERAAGAPERPRTLLLEWTDPLFSAGHWNPELLALAAGALAPWDRPGEPSRTLTWDEVRTYAPEMLVLIPCGFDADRAVEEASTLADLPGWFDLPAVRAGECYAADGGAYFNRPGPRLAESAEILATILHPEAFTEMLPPYSVRRFPSDLLEPEKP